jgi:hypothetical protein
MNNTEAAELINERNLASPGDPVRPPMQGVHPKSDRTGTSCAASPFRGRGLSASKRDRPAEARNLVGRSVGQHGKHRAGRHARAPEDPFSVSAEACRRAAAIFSSVSCFFRSPLWAKAGAARELRLGKPPRDYQTERQAAKPTWRTLPTKISKTTPCKVAGGRWHGCLERILREHFDMSGKSAAPLHRRAIR